MLLMNYHVEMVHLNADLSDTAAVVAAIVALLALLEQQRQLLLQM